MDYRKIAVLTMLMMCFGLANAVDFNVTVTNPGDLNYLYPSRGATVAINFDVNDMENSGDVNFNIYYSTVSSAFTTTIIDANAGDICASPDLTTTKACTYTWTIPSNFDSNYYIDVNAYDRATVDGNYAASSGAFYIDTNACTTVHTADADDTDKFTLSTICTGLSGDANSLGTQITYWSKSRQGRCASNYISYSSAISLTFGTFNVCYYSTDGLGNTETTKTFVHEADSAAVAIATLTELGLAALILMVIAMFLMSRQLIDVRIALALTVGAVIIVISIVIFATIL